MKSFNIKYLILSLTLFGCCSVSVYSDSRWDGFLKQPSKDSFVVLENEVSTSAKCCSWGDPKNHDVVSVEAGQQLFGLIAKGNEFAFYIGLLVEKCLDGGELGDFYRHVGLYFESNPVLFLNTINSKFTPEGSFKSMLTMLPEITVDDIEQQLYITQKRIALLESIDQNKLLELKEIGLLFLKEQETSLKKIIE